MKLFLGSLYFLYGFVSQMYRSLAKEEDLIYRGCLLLDGFLLLKLLPILWNWAETSFSFRFVGNLPYHFSRPDLQGLGAANASKCF